MGFGEVSSVDNPDTAILDFERYNVALQLDSANLIGELGYKLTVLAEFHCRQQAAPEPALAVARSHPGRLAGAWRHSMVPHTQESSTERP
jgi:hypothetical protein